MKLQGKKTYIAAGLFVLITALQAFKVITPEQAKMLYALAGSFGLFAVRKAIEGK